MDRNGLNPKLYTMKCSHALGALEHSRAWAEDWQAKLSGIKHCCSTDTGNIGHRLFALHLLHVMQVVAKPVSQLTKGLQTKS